MHLPRHATHARLVAGLADLAADAVRDLLVAFFTRPRARAIRNLLVADFLGVGANGVGDRLVADFLCARADRVRNLLVTDLLRGGAGGVGLFVHRRAGNLAADRVRHLDVLHLGLVARAANFLLHGLLDPDAAAASRRRALHLHQVAATRAIEAAASTGIPFKVAGIALALIHLGAGDRFRHRLPLTAADGDHFLFDNRLAARVALVAIAGLRLRLVRRAGDVPRAGLVAGFADRVAAVFVAGLVVRLADRVADVLVAGLTTGVADRVADVLVARLEARFADREADVFVARLKHVTRAGVRDLFANVVVNRLAADSALLFPNRFLNGLVARRGTARRRAARLRGAVIAARCARLRRATGVAPQKPCGGAAARLGQRQRDNNRYPGCVFHWFALVGAA